MTSLKPSIKTAKLEIILKLCSQLKHKHYTSSNTLVVLSHDNVETSQTALFFELVKQQPLTESLNKSRKNDTHKI